MPTPNNTQSLARYAEATQGTGPADWDASGVRMRFVAGSADFSSLKQTTIEDERSQENVQDYDQVVLGIKGGVEFPFDVYLHGLEATTASGSTVTQNELSELLEHCLGGVHLSRSTTATGGTTTTAVLTDDTDISLGCHLGVVQSGRVWIRRVIAHNAGTNTVTFDQALPAAVANGDVIHGCATHYFDEDVLNDSSVGPSTWSLLGQVGGRGSAREWYELNGCKLHVDSISLSRNALPKASIKAMVASFQTPDEVSDVSWTSDPEGAAPVAVGPRTSFWIEDYGTSTNTTRHCMELNVKPGGKPSPIETITEAEDGMPGIAAYGLTRDKTTASLKMLFSQAEYQDFSAQTLKQLRWQRDGGAGRTIAVGMYRAEIMSPPVPTAVNPSLGEDFELHALRNTDDSATTDLWRSRMVIVLC